MTINPFTYRTEILIFILKLFYRVYFNFHTKMYFCFLAAFCIFSVIFNIMLRSSFLIIVILNINVVLQER